jgi:hypothetical protein
MPKRRLLVVTTSAADEPALREEVREHAGEEEADIHVIAPAAELSRLQWLASDEDEARAEAQKVARETSKAIGETGKVEEAEIGDPDPVQAIEDALRKFPADELIIVTRSGEDASWLEQGSLVEARERFRLPTTHLVLSRPG